MSAKKEKVLGRGLSALLGEDSSQYDIQPVRQATENKQPANDRYKEILIQTIQANKQQPRKIFDETALQELSDSIKKYGVLQPIIVREKDANNYEIIAGERRWRAAQKAGLKSLPAVIQKADNENSMKLALIENIQRAELSPLEEAIAYENLMEIYKYTQEALATSLGKSRSHIANMLRLNKLEPAVKKALSDGKISYGHARCLIGNAQADEYVSSIVNNNLTVRELESALKQSKKSPSKNKVAKLDTPTDADIKIIEAKLSDSLKAKVHIVMSERENKVVVYFNDYNQLDDIINKMS